MRTVTISTSSTYDVLIGSHLLENAHQYIQAMKQPCTVAIISNQTVWPLHGKQIHHSLSTAGYRVIYHCLPDGERFKNQTSYMEILAFLAENKVTRSDLVIALGGGVIGDITGFCAATYLRGVDYVQIPTTLLAMVDSSVGGKTAIDLPQGKNLVGVFYQPKLVLCDTQVLSTLPRQIFIDGCAEVIKYGILYDRTLFEHLSSRGLKFDLEYVISRCVQLKGQVVSLDEFDTGLRQKLNLGHTVGHAVELLSDYAISHGQAVAIGIGIITKAASALAFCDDGVYRDICNTLQLFHLPCCLDAHIAQNPIRFSNQKIYTAALSDKKRSGETVSLIIPLQIGNCAIQRIDVTELLTFIEKGTT